MPTLDDLADRVERLLLRHDELKRTNALLEQQLAHVSAERDGMKARLATARARIDILLGACRARPAPRSRGRHDMKQIEATIMGQSYILGCPEGGEHDLLAAVAAVDREMSAIRDAGRVKARERIAVLAALNLAFALEQRPSAPPANGHAAGDGKGSDVDLAALIARLDLALGEDGRLL